MAACIGDLSADRTHFWDGEIWQWQPLWLHPDEVLRAVRDVFGRRAAGANYLASGALNQSWNIDSKYVLRVSRADRERAQVDYEHHVILAVHRELDIVVPPLPAPSGDTVMERNGRLLSLFPFVEGVSGTEIDATMRTRESATVLARIHQVTCAARFEQRPGFSMVDEHPRWPWLAQRAVLESDLGGDHEATDLIARIDAQYAELGRWLDGLSRSGRRLRRGVVHGDFNPRNLIFRGDRVCAVIDWDHCHRDSLACEVAFTPDVDRDEFFRFYLAAGGPLEPGEADLLAGFAQIGCLSEIQWAVDDGRAGPDARAQLREVAASMQPIS